MRNLQSPLFVFDLETTMDPDNRKIVEIGGLYVEKNHVPIGTYFTALVDTGEPIEPALTTLTGITNSEVETHGVSEKEALERLLKYLREKSGTKKCTPACWGTYFDVPILRRAFLAHDMRWPLIGMAFDVKSYYTGVCYALGIKPKSSLFKAHSQLRERLNQPLAVTEYNAHRAHDDAIVTFHVYQLTNELLAQTTCQTCVARNIKSG